MHIELRGFAVLEKLPQNYVAVANGAFRRLMEDIRDRARQNVAGMRPGLISRTGNLWRKIKLGPYRQMTVGGVGEQRLIADTIYASVHEPPDGRRFTTISAKRKPYLVFRIMNYWDTSQPSGPWVRKKQVTIPARPFLKPAVGAAIRLWPNYIEETTAYLLRES